ncbi:uncharacterized protein LOC100893864 [Strongylocentrotus purpuratus]|uniref:HYR domain-containing protein n=1 Tax=Strongylocentrotus purpuratus TaxID=7668 RepID=A0A7M7HMJ2_STRPU|nr:uncharacterized protein LOC100893864 [Strongylocentrotus purpuratus]
MDGSGNSSSMPAWLCTVALMAFMVHAAQAQDTTPPNVTCDDVTTRPFLPNSFLGLSVDTTYTYDDLNPDPSGITYNVTKGPFGDLFPPGRTPVTMYAVDIFNNRATCLFYVENTLTELPVNCPDLNRTVATDMGLPTYSYTPSIEASDVTKTTSGYRYHGVGVSVDPSMAFGSKLDVGTHPDTVIIYDEVLSKTCMGYIVVQDIEKPNVTCPADITDSSTNVIQYSANVTDNVGASVTYSPEPGSRFNPGVTMVSVIARDQTGLNDTCSFVVQVTISELPVLFPSEETVQLDSAESTYQYPAITEDKLTLMDPTYQFYGDVTVVVLVNGTKNYSLSIGTYILTILIDDTVFNKTCSSVIRVEKGKSLNRISVIVAVIVTCAVVLLVVFVIVCCVCYVKKRHTRGKIEVTRSGGKQSSSEKTSAV